MNINDFLYKTDKELSGKEQQLRKLIKEYIINRSSKESYETYVKTHSNLISKLSKELNVDFFDPENPADFRSTRFLGTK